MQDSVEGLDNFALLLLAGFHVDFSSLRELGVLSLAYVLARTLGGVCAGYLGAKITGFSATVSKLIGFCMLPQAGVAIGLGLLAAERFPALAAEIIAVVVGTSFIFEIIGPLVTCQALERAGEIP